MSTVMASRKRIHAEKPGRRKSSSKLGAVRLKDAPVSPNLVPATPPVKHDHMEEWDQNFTEWNGAGPTKGSIRNVDDTAKKGSPASAVPVVTPNGKGAIMSPGSPVRSFDGALASLTASGEIRGPASPGDKWGWGSIANITTGFTKAISLLTDDDAGPTLLEEKLGEAASGDDNSIVGSGLDAINSVGKLALGMANVIDNTIEGGLHLLHTSGGHIKTGAGAVKNKLSPNKAKPAPKNIFAAPGVKSPPTKQNAAAKETQQAKESRRQKPQINASVEYLADLWGGDFEEWEDAPSPPRAARASSSSGASGPSSSAAAAAAAQASETQRAADRERQLEGELDALRSQHATSKQQQVELQATIQAMESDLKMAKVKVSRLRSANKQIQERFTQNAETESLDLGEQLRQQMECLLSEKAKLASENARLKRENDSLQELLMHAVGTSDEEEHDTSYGEDQQWARGGGGAAGGAGGAAAGGGAGGDGGGVTTDEEREPVRLPASPRAMAAGQDREADAVADALLASVLEFAQQGDGEWPEVDSDAE